MKKPNVNYFFHDDFIFDYSGLVEPTSQAAMLGYKAIAWNTSLNMTGWWQGRNVIGMTTNDSLFDMSKGDISQAVQIQQTWKAGENLPWLWEAAQGVNDKMTISTKAAVPVSWGSNLQQSNFLIRYEDVSKLQAGTDHGQRLWIQPVFFDNKYPYRPMEVYKDPYTNFEDIVVNVSIKRGEKSEYFDFSKSAEIQQHAFNDLRDFEVTQSRAQFDLLLRHIETRLGVDLQNETGYYSVIQAGVTSEMASFPANAPKWGIGHEGAMQSAFSEIHFYDN